MADWRGSWPRWTWRRVPRNIYAILTTGPILAAIGGVLVVALITAIMINDRSTGFGLLVFTPIMVPLITAGLLAGRGLLGLGGWLPNAMRIAQLARHACPACNYDLRGIDPVHPEGMSEAHVVCPECRATWVSANLGPAARARPETVVIRGWERTGAIPPNFPNSPQTPPQP